MNAAAVGARMILRHTFPAMGSTIELALAAVDDRDPAGAWRLAEELAGEWEQTFSRFRPDSELSRLNAAAGLPVAVSPRLYDAVAAAVEGNRLSGGLFDPTVLPALVALGYDRTFDDIDGCPEPGHPERERRMAGHQAEGRARAVPGVGGIALHPAARTIRLPAGVALDLGGIAKGLYADALAALLGDWPGGCVSAGGDLRVWGDGPSGEGWLVGVEDPADRDHDIASIRVREGGVATSGTNRRSWQRGRAEVHHLIDPRTGRSSDRSPWSVTVVGQSAGLAEVAATTLFLSGGAPDALTRFAGRVGPALVVERDGSVRTIDRVGY